MCVGTAESQSGLATTTMSQKKKKKGDDDDDDDDETRHQQTSDDMHKKEELCCYFFTRRVFYSPSTYDDDDLHVHMDVEEEGKGLCFLSINSCSITSFVAHTKTQQQQHQPNLTPRHYITSYAHAYFLPGPSSSISNTFTAQERDQMRN